MEDIFDFKVEIKINSNEPTIYFVDIKNLKLRPDEINKVIKYLAQYH